MSEVDFSELKGKTFKKINQCEAEIIFFVKNDVTYYRMFHLQNCCENVYIEDICGDLNDLINSKILYAEEYTSYAQLKEDEAESFTYTFYKLSTIKGSVTIRWYGASNGYYSEIVSLFKEYEFN